MRPRHVLTLVAMPLATALVLAGCSSGDDDGESADATTTTEVTTTTTGTLERYADYEPEVYADLANWVCHPDADDICDDGLDATVVEADGTLTEEPWQADPDAPIDCFYVYPTISLDTTEIADRNAGDEERFVTLNQAARLGETCRVFAPVYRQRTLAGLTSALTGSTTTTVAGQQPEPSPGYTDVLDAFSTYMATENDGRGVVLIGHSQGAGVLNQLIREEVDPNPEVRDQLVAAYLAGSSVRVPEGADVGGDFEQIPLCRSEDQTGCVISWASFRSPMRRRPRTRCSDDPAPGRVWRPATARRRSRAAAPRCTRTSRRTPTPRSCRRSVSARTGPRSGRRAARSRRRSSPHRASSPPSASRRTASTTWRSPSTATPPIPRVDDIGGDLTPEWGLHLQDVNLVMGDMVRLVGTQTAAWQAARD